MLYRMQFDWVSDIHQIRAEGTINNEKFEMSRHKSSLINWNELFQQKYDGQLLNVFDFAICDERRAESQLTF